MVAVAMGGGALLSFSFGKKGGVVEISEIGVATSEMGELPLFPLLIKREGADVPLFRIKNHPRSLPRRRIQRVLLREGAVDTE